MRGLWSTNSSVTLAQSPGWVIAENIPGFQTLPLGWHRRDEHRWAMSPRLFRPHLLHSCFCCLLHSWSQAAAYADSGGLPHMGRLEVGVESMLAGNPQPPEPHYIGAEAGVEELGVGPGSSASFRTRAAGVSEVGTSAGCVVAFFPCLSLCRERGIVRLLASRHGIVTCPAL